MGKYLAVDMGGTFIKYSILDENYRIQEEGSVPSRQEPIEFFNQLLAIVDSYQDKIEGIALSMAGTINPKTGVNNDFSVGPRFRDYNYKKELENRYKMPVLLENDSNCAALGEMIQGAGKGCKDFCMITFGTGIGGSIIINGNLYRGRNFRAGEIGITSIGIRQENGCVVAEEAGATAVLARKVSKLLGKEVNGKYILENLDSPQIAAAYQEWVVKAAAVVANMGVTIDPAKILIGGGISENQQFIKDIRAAVYKMYPHLEEFTEIIACKQGNMAGRIGALYLLLHSLKQNEEEEA